MGEGCCSKSGGSSIECQNEQQWGKTLYMLCVGVRVRDRERQMILD